ncbi:Chromosome partitioning related protein [Xenorhabdus nematophila str. Anatoliense]|nr:Chromosome partitioning related protein [Xenorhabdus nematophila str. Anatoliense]
MQQVSSNLVGFRKSPIIVPFVSTKGGEGKSTKAGNTAGFCADAGLRTLLLDADHSQPTASSLFKLVYEAPTGLYELLMQTADLSSPETIISQTDIPNLDVIVSNDPDDRLPVAMLHAPDGRMRLRNILQHPLFSQYDVIIIDSKGAGSIMLEMILLAASDYVLGIIKPILPDTREFLRGTLGLMGKLLPLCAYGITIPSVRILANCVEDTILDKTTLDELASIIKERRYPFADSLSVSLLDTQIPKLEVYKHGHAQGLPVHRLEYKTNRKTPAAAVTMHNLVCELFPQWKSKFDLVLEKGLANEN